MIFVYCVVFRYAEVRDVDGNRQSIYAKTQSIDPSLSEAVVEHSAKRAIELQEALELGAWDLLPGYRCLSVDGNVLAKSDKRLKVLREAKGAPLPGKVVARFDLQRQVFDRVYVLLDGHSQDSPSRWARNAFVRNSGFSYPVSFRNRALSG